MHSYIHAHACMSACHVCQPLEIPRLLFRNVLERKKSAHIASSYFTETIIKVMTMRKHSFNKSNEEYLMKNIFFSNYQKGQLVNFLKKVFMQYLCNNLPGMYCSKASALIKPKVSVP